MSEGQLNDRLDNTKEKIWKQEEWAVETTQIKIKRIFT